MPVHLIATFTAPLVDALRRTAEERRKSFRVEGGVIRRARGAREVLRPIAVRRGENAGVAGRRVYLLEVELADGSRLVNAYLDADAFERDQAAMVERGSYRVAAIRHEGEAPPPIVPQAPKGRRGDLALLVLPLLVVTAAAAFIGLDAYTRLRPKPSKAGTAQAEGRAVRQAAELFVSLIDVRDVCPDVDDLVRAKLLAPQKADDPWGTPYRVRCAGSHVSVRSAGPDRRFGTADDVDPDAPRR